MVRNGSILAHDLVGFTEVWSISWHFDILYRNHSNLSGRFRYLSRLVCPLAAFLNTALPVNGGRFLVFDWRAYVIGGS